MGRESRVACLAVALAFVGCKTPNKYTPSDAEVGEGVVDGSPPPPDLATSLKPDASVAADVSAPPPDAAAPGPDVLPADTAPPPCSNGTARCAPSGTAVELCSNGVWTLKENCPLTCSGATCTAVCMAGVACTTGIPPCRKGATACPSPTSQPVCTDVGSDDTKGGCGGGQVCSGGQCRCPASAPVMCGGSCKSVTDDAQNCGTCGHSCLGGACLQGACQPVSIYSRDDANWRGLAVDATYVYFLREKATNVQVLARVRKDGTQATDLTQGDIGFTFPNFAIANGTIYWTAATALMGCALPDCSGGPTVKMAGQNGPRSPFSNQSRTKLFWVANQGANDGSLLMTLSSQAPIATSSTGFRPPGAANDSFVWIQTSNLTRIPVGGGALVEIGEGRAPLAINSSQLLFLKEVNASGSSLLHVFKHAQSAGMGSLPQSIGNYPYGGLGGDLVVDDQNAYWLFSAAARGTLPEGYVIATCPVSGCGANPKILVLGDGAGDNDVGGLVGDSQALYWATSSGIYKVAK